jgi:hypothetical protein
MSNPVVTYTPLPNVTEEAECSVLASVYRLIPDKSGPDDGTNSKEDSANEHRST